VVAQCLMIKILGKCRLGSSIEDVIKRGPTCLIGGRHGRKNGCSPEGQDLDTLRCHHTMTLAMLQAPESYNLSGLLEQVKKANASHASD
jgi:hypothetical protein